MTVEERLRQDLANCEAELLTIRTEIGSLQREEIALREKSAYIRSVLQDGEQKPNPNQQELLDVKPPEKTIQSQTRKLTMIEMAVEILTKAGGRLKMDDIVTRAIVEKMRDAPTPESRRKLRANLSSVLSHYTRSDNPKIVKSKKRGFYKLAEVRPVEDVIVAKSPVKMEF